MPRILASSVWEAVARPSGTPAGHVCQPSTQALGAVVRRATKIPALEGPRQEADGPEEGAFEC